MTKEQTCLATVLVSVLIVLMLREEYLAGHYKAIAIFACIGPVADIIKTIIEYFGDDNDDHGDYEYAGA